MPRPGRFPFAPTGALGALAHGVLAATTRSYAPLFALAAVAFATSVHVGCASDRDDDTLTEDPLYGYTPVEPPPCGPLAPTEALFQPPTALHQGVCTDAQLNELVPCALSGSCAPRPPGDAACSACLASGLFIPTGGTNQRYSRGACATALGGDPNDTCGAQVERLEQCVASACAACSGDASVTCQRAAARGACAAFALGSICYRSLPGTVQRTCRDPFTAARTVCGN